MVGAYTADAMLQFFGLGSFLLVVFPTMLGVRWFRSLKVQSPLAKSLVFFSRFCRDNCAGST